MDEFCALVRGGGLSVRKIWLVAAGLFLSLLLVACIGETASTGEVTATDTPLEAQTTTTTTEVANRPPEIRVASVGRAEIGQQFTEAILGFDPDGDDVIVSISDGPLGFVPTLNTRGRVTGFTWEPVEPGEWTVEVTGTDPDGATTSAEVLLVARNPRSVDLLLAMGDSVAAGFGRDRSDLLGIDDCSRSEAAAYGIQTHQELVDVGSLGADGGALLVACAGATTTSVINTSVAATDPTGEVTSDAARSQLQWALDLNPTIVTLTIGVSDLGFFDAERVDEIVTPSPEARAQHETFAENLATIVTQLVAATDAHVAITTYYDPVASSPNGIEGCENECFQSVFSERITALNETITSVAENFPEGRLSLVRLDGENDVWEAGNATGPDILREGLGPLDGLVDQFTGGGGATCASDGAPDRDLISGLDCVHPNADGHGEIRRLVVEALLSI